jgi:hypothetical protein
MGISIIDRQAFKVKFYQIKYYENNKYPRDGFTPCITLKTIIKCGKHHKLKNVIDMIKDNILLMKHFKKYYTN